MTIVLERKEFDLDGHHIVQELKSDKYSDSNGVYFGAGRWLTYIDGEEWNYKWSWLKGHETCPSKSKIRKQIEMYF